MAKKNKAELAAEAEAKAKAEAEERAKAEEEENAKAEAQAKAEAEEEARKNAESSMPKFQGSRCRIKDICSVTLAGKQIKPAPDGYFDLTDEQLKLAIEHGLEIQEVKRR